MQKFLIQDVVFDRDNLLIVSNTPSAPAQSSNMVYRFVQKAANSRASHRTVKLYQRTLSAGKDLIKK